MNLVAFTHRGRSQVLHVLHNPIHLRCCNYPRHLRMKAPQDFDDSAKSTKKNHNPPSNVGAIRSANRKVESSPKPPGISTRISRDKERAYDKSTKSNNNNQEKIWRKAVPAFNRPTDSKQPWNQLRSSKQLIQENPTRSLKAVHLDEPESMPNSRVFPSKQMSTSLKPVNEINLEEIKSSVMKDLLQARNSFPQASSQQWEYICQYSMYLLEWNEKVNLISRKDVVNLCANHIVPPLSMSFVCPFKENESIVDVGTGGGLPGKIEVLICSTMAYNILICNRSTLGYTLPK